MKKVKDIFSDRSVFYKKYRPTYPQQLYDEILKNVFTINSCWDCGTGNGQVAVELSKSFQQVYATDISENQLAQAEKKKNIIYKIERAEKTSFDDSQFDLITAAQCIHWFGLDEFFMEVKRVAKNGAVLCIWGYNLVRINNIIDDILDKFYWDIVGEYWDAERQHVDNEYKSIQFDFDEIKINKTFVINNRWTINEFEGYLNSWSSVHHYLRINKTNPVNWIIERVKQHWNTNMLIDVSFPIFIRLARIEK